ncbi:hypothetical protein CVT26_004944 [Gymnopilus dilepis]|uniref:Uncharacterized protein n=1 Tax=Gymnopilus dilepis TaxID=231916 RepID=A0A409WBY9_9AGAR|nr:hypothetical protein CVT26_004944 [Gymnopilus dilepis]
MALMASQKRQPDASQVIRPTRPKQKNAFRQLISSYHATASYTKTTGTLPEVYEGNEQQKSCPPMQHQSISCRKGKWLGRPSLAQKIVFESATKLIEVIRKLKKKTMEAARANRGIDAQEGGPGRELQVTGASGNAARSRSQRPTERQVLQSQLTVSYIALAIFNTPLNKGR